jgi:poly-beta-1,6-N-acetyl-D-glucosamine N-deacetylase
VPAPRWIWSVLRWSGLPALAREVVQRRRVTILFYHEIDPSALSRHLTVLGAHYDFVALRDYMEARRSKDATALPKHAIVVTLDDGLKSNFQLLEVFERHSVVPTMFVTSGIIGTDRRFWWTMVPGGRAETERLKRVPDAERVAALRSAGHSETEAFPDRTALSRAEVEEMRGYADFQSHTVLHPILSRCSDERAWNEIAGSRMDLENDYGFAVYALAYPNGTLDDFGDREVTLAARAGYGCALTTVPGTNDLRTDPFRLRRIIIPADASRDEIVVKASLLTEYVKRLLPFARRPLHVSSR